MKAFPTLQTSRLLLRQILPSDQRNIFNGLSHPEVIRHYGVSFDTFEATKEQMDWFANLEATGTGIWWAICSPDNQEFYGAGGLCDLHKEHRRAEVGFWLLPDYWGKGFLGEAMPLIMDYAFNDLELRRVEGYVESDNDKCKKAIAKAGLEYEGTMRDCEVKGGRFISVDIYSRLSPK